MTTIENIEISKLKPNPYRDLDTYPWVEEKIEALIKSYNDIGVMVGITARPCGDGTYEKWFGHHREEAAKRIGLTHLPIIVQDATDEMMIKAMAYENGEDYATDFLIQLNTWEGGLKYLRAKSPKNPEPLEVARLLGMTEPDERGKHGDRLNRISQSCNAAHALIVAGHLDRADLHGITVSAARELTQAMLSQMERIDKMAKVSKAPAASAGKAKKHVSKAGKVTAKRVREGKVSTKAIRTEVSANAFTNAAEAAKDDAPLPLFSAFADTLCRSIGKILVDGYTAEKLVQVYHAINSITLEDDRVAVRRVQFELEELGKRSGMWSRRLTPTGEKLVALK